MSVCCTLIVVGQGDGGDLWMLGSSTLVLDAPSMTFSKLLGKKPYRKLPAQGVSSYMTGKTEDGKRCYGSNVREDQYGEELRVYTATDVLECLRESAEPERPLLVYQEAAIGFLSALGERDLIVPFWH